MDWSERYKDNKRRRIPLPPYPFERQRYWIDRPGALQIVPGRVETTGQAAEKDKQPPPPKTEGRIRPNLSNPYVAPRNDSEDVLVHILEEVLGIGQVGVFDDFFEIGGNSLFAARIATRIKEKFRMEFSLNHLFENPTIAGIAGQIETLRQSVQDVPVSPVDESEDREEGEI